MSYALKPVPLEGLGTFDPWWSLASVHVLSPSSVYVLRLPCFNLPLKDGSDLLLFARAAGQSQGLDLDVRAVGAKGSGTTWSVDVVMTTSASKAWLFPYIGEMVSAVANDEQLKASFPALQIDSDKAEFGELTGPKDAIDTWLAQPLLWDHALTGAKKRGGPTATFAKPVDLSTFQGQADEGRAAAPWRVTSPPISPQHQEEPSNVGWYIVGGAAVLGVGLAIWMRSRKR